MATISTTAEPRRRNAAQTRQSLLDVARRRFAKDGYAATTVRDIADEAGVNVALINRYFTSKEGLFEACLTTAVTELDREADGFSRAQAAAAIARRLAGSTGGTPMHEALLLLLRSSGDERIDELRRGVLQSFSERLAVAAGGRELPEGSPLLLRAQVVIAASLGLTLLRSVALVPPVAGATEEDLLGPLTDLVNAMLPEDGR